jgi:hypothetical protein
MSRSLASLADLVQQLKINPLVDGAEVFFPTLNREQQWILRRIGVVKPCSRCWGSYRLIVTRPSRQILRRLDALASQYRGVLSRVDVALEISTEDHRQLRLWIEHHAILRHRRRGPMHAVEGTVYWRSWKKRWRCNLVLYSDKPNRITGEVDCVHLELRLARATTIRQHGIHRIADLLTLNPQQLFARHLVWSDFADRYVEKIVRKNADANPDWIRKLMRVLGYDIAQTLKDAFPRRVSNAKKLVGLPIPTVLDWPPPSSLR